MQRNKRGIIGTFIFHTILLIMFIFWGFSTPLPLPAEQGILINFGDADVGIGRVEPKKNIQEKRITQKPAVKEKVFTEQENITQDFEEAPSINQKASEKNKTKNETVENKQPVKEPEEKPVEKPTRKVNELALYKGKKDAGNTGAEGVTKGDGNQGSETGSVSEQSHFVGNSKGGGISYSLEGRYKLSLPEPEFEYQKDGKVVVEITVNRQGKVTNAIPGVKGSTTLDTYLLGVAKKAALRAKFNTKNDAPAFQKGTITYIFKLK